MRILILSGPNLDLLGRREPDLYGQATLDAIMTQVGEHAQGLGVEIDTLQSNDEGTLVTAVGRSGQTYDGIVFNPAAYTHTSVALYDAIRASGTPCVEVHMSNVYAREEFRRKSMTAAACVGQVSGFGADSYVVGLEALVRHLRRAREAGAKDGVSA